MMDWLKECTVGFFLITYQSNLALLDFSWVLSWRMEVIGSRDQCTVPVVWGDAEGAGYQQGELFLERDLHGVLEITAPASCSPSVVLVYLPLLSAEPSLFSGAAACGAEAYPQGVVLVGVLLCWIRWARMFLHCLGEDIKARPCFLFGVTTFLCL